MELCPEGTLESLVELNGGLPEAQTRRYTHQLLSAVAELHRNGVVHRDIKTANIFLHKDGNCLKLGDFGSAVQIQAHTTMVGELKGYVGTQGKNEIVYGSTRYLIIYNDRVCLPTHSIHGTGSIYENKHRGTRSGGRYLVRWLRSD